jgi:hypothetical protein
MPPPMTDHRCRKRLDAVFAGRTPDRTPVAGGWISCPEHIMRFAEVGPDAYWADPVGVSLEAYRRLGTDGIIDCAVPLRRDDYRIVDAHSYARADKGYSLEEVLALIEGMPSAERFELDFDFEEKYAAYRRELVRMQARCGDMVWMPACWSAGAKVTWFFDLGYECFFVVVGGYPDHARKLMELGGAQGRCFSRMVARAVREGLVPRALLLGEDICTQRGPMVSPDFLEEYYAPQLRYGLEPLLEAGCRPVWHCDGDVRPIIGLLIDAGIQGLQGFQPECGLTIEWAASQRTRDGGRMLIYGPLSVTTELPVCSPREVAEKVRHAISVCRGTADLVLFTSNTINPDVPLDNILAMYEAVR